jgi:hypothetical protein
VGSGGGNVDGISEAPKIVAADVPDRGRMYYLVDSKYDFILDAKEFFDWKAAINRALRDYRVLIEIVWRNNERRRF